MFVCYKKIIRVSKIVFRLMASAASLSIISHPSVFIGGAYASEENQQAQAIVDKLHLTLLSAAEDDPTLKFRPIMTLRMADIIKDKEEEKKKLENPKKEEKEKKEAEQPKYWTLAHQQEALFAVLQALDKKRDGVVLRCYDLQNQFASFQKAAKEFQDTFITLLALEVSNRANSLIDEVECNVLANVKAPYIYLALAWKDYAIKSQQLIEIYHFTKDQIEKEIREETNKIENVFQDSRKDFEKLLSAIKTEFDTEKQTLEANIERINDLMAKEGDASYKQSSMEQIENDTKKLKLNEINRKAEIDALNSKFSSQTAEKNAKINNIQEEKTKKLVMLEIQLKYILEEKGGSFFRSKKAERYALGLPLYRTDYIEGFAQLDDILQAYPQLIQQGEDKFATALFNRFETNEEGKLRRRVLELFLKIKAPKIDDVEKGEEPKISHSIRGEARKESKISPTIVENTPAKKTRIRNTTTTTTTTSTTPAVGNGEAIGKVLADGYKRKSLTRPLEVSEEKDTLLTQPGEAGDTSLAGPEVNQEVKEPQELQKEAGPVKTYVEAAKTGMNLKEDSSEIKEDSSENSPIPQRAEIAETSWTSVERKGKKNRTGWTGGRGNSSK